MEWDNSLLYTLRLKYTRCFLRPKTKGKCVKLDKRDTRLLFMWVLPTMYKCTAYSDRNRSHNTSLWAFSWIPSLPYKLENLILNLIYSICNSSINFHGFTFRCLWNLLMEHEAIFWKDSFITKALTTGPKIKVDFIVRLQIEESNWTKPHCIFPQLGFIDTSSKSCFFLHHACIVPYVGN